jgi:ABC-2 family transporter protein
VPTLGRRASSCGSGELGRASAPLSPDIPLANQVTRTAAVLPIALLTLATFFGAPIISALVAGDIVSSEDANNTLRMILTRSTTRSTIYWAKVLAAASYGIVLMAVLFATSMIGSSISWGLHGATLLDGHPQQRRGDRGHGHLLPRLPGTRGLAGD